MGEASPFGWPLAPNDWEFKSQECWGERHPLCSGLQQSPMDIDLQSGSTKCQTEVAGTDGVLESKSRYWEDVEMHHSPTVKVSNYMRTVMAEGSFGELTLQDAKGQDMVYEAVQVHLAAPGLHTVNGKSHDAEMLVVHKLKGSKNMLEGSVIVSVLFSIDTAETAASPIFNHMGFSTPSSAAEESSSWTVKPFGVASTIKPALRGPSYQYNGSVPVPPCSETVSWIILTTPQSVSEGQVRQLEDKVRDQTGGTKKRQAVARHPANGDCRRIVKNGVQAVPSHEEATCKMMAAEGRATQVARCWSMSQACGVSPIDVQTQSATAMPKADIAELLHYKPVEHVTVVPSNYTLDASVRHGSFGHIMLNGRMFEAKRVMIKPISSHTINGVRHSGELIIEHTLFGDDFGSGHAASPASAAGTHDTDAGAGHRRLNDAAATGHQPQVTSAAGHGGSMASVGDGSSTASAGGDGMASSTGHGGSTASSHGSGTGPHKVMISVPLKMGVESALLRHMGLGQPQVKQAIRDAHAYNAHDTIDLSDGLSSVFSGPWYWYSGTPVLPETTCASWGTRWMVFETPLEVSLAQLNFLSLKVSGVDSTPLAPEPPMTATKLWKQAVPGHGVDAVQGDSEACPAEGWDYMHVRCWGQSYAVCDSGTKQSPINIQMSDVSNTGKDSFLAGLSWKPVRGLQVQNTGNSLQVLSNQLGYFTMTGDNGFPSYYQVTQMVLHMPSEHLVNNKQFAAELQVVHQRQETVEELQHDDYLIASFMFDLGSEESALLKQMYSPTQQVLEGTPRKIEQPVDLMRAFGPAVDGHFYKYDGSLTIPNCAENVKWFVFETPTSMSQEQWTSFKALFPNPGNNRPVQPLAGRTISKNSFEQGVPANYDFFLNRKVGRDRWQPAPGAILVPIVGTVLLTVAIMFSTFVREDIRRKRESAGGLEQTIGKAQPYAQF